MNQPEINLGFYQDELESFLLKLQQEINQISLAYVSEHMEMEQLDNYLHEINSFYYRSFQENFFPAYKKSLNQEFSRLLKLSRQQDTIKQDILSSLKRYAKLYNQVKSICSNLIQCNEDSLNQLHTAHGELDRHSMELFYSLKSFRDTFKTLTGISHSLNLLTGDKELLEVLNREPAFAFLLKSISSRDSSNPAAMNDFYQLNMNLHQIKNQTVKLLQDKDKVISPLTNLEKEIRDFKNKFVVPLSLLETSITRSLLLYLDIMLLHIQMKDEKQALATASKLVNLLSDILLVMEKGISYKFAGYNPLLDVSLITSIQPAYMNELDKTFNNTTEQAEQLLQKFPEHGDVDYSYFSAKARAIVENTTPLLGNTSGTAAIERPHILDSIINRAALELSFLVLRLDLLEEKRQHSSVICERYSVLANILDKYIAFLSNIKSDLERLLAPRNISRSWKDILIRADKIPLEKGGLFPQDYLFLLDKHQVETRITEQADNNILEEEGDIFIFRVDDLVEEELPYLVVSKKYPQSE